jgi:hypothetical protein
MDFFEASIQFDVGDSHSTLFWTDPWLNRHYLSSSMLELFDIVPTNRRKTDMVASALDDNAWIQYLVGLLIVSVLIQCLHLREQLVHFSLAPDGVRWRWCSSGQYSFSPTYQALHFGEVAVLSATEAWKIKAPHEHCFFLWLAIQDSCCTSQRLQ